MRVTTNQLYNSLMSGVARQQNIQNQGNAQISSGTRFQTPAQAGIDYKVSLDLRQAKVGLQGDLGAVNTAETRLNTSLTALNDMANVLKRAETVAVQLSSAGTGASQRLAGAQEATQLLNQFFNDANQQWQGQSLFAGTAVDKAPFSTVPFNAGTAAFTAGANTSISNITQTANPYAVNDTYAITLDAAGTSIAAITNSAGANLLAAPVTLVAGANAVSLSDGAALNLTYSGTAIAGNPAAGSVGVTGAAGTISYSGNNQDRVVITGNGQQIISNVRGDNPAFAAAFSALETFKTALQNNDTTGLQNALGSLINAGDSIINTSSDAGARLASVRLNKTAITDRQLNLDIQLNTHEAVDIPAVVASMQQSSIALKAAYSQISQIKSLSLTNFLR
ncbi:MAG: flagellar hook-associated protein FlgL [Mariprofundus sp.]